MNRILDRLLTVLMLALLDGPASAPCTAAVFADWSVVTNNLPRYALGVPTGSALAAAGVDELLIVMTAVVGRSDKVGCVRDFRRSGPDGSARGGAACRPGLSLCPPVRGVASASRCC